MHSFNVIPGLNHLVFCINNTSFHFHPQVVFVVSTGGQRKVNTQCASHRSGRDSDTNYFPTHPQWWIQPDSYFTNRKNECPCPYHCYCGLIEKLYRSKLDQQLELILKKGNQSDFSQYWIFFATITSFHFHFSSMAVIVQINHTFTRCVALLSSTVV